MIFEICLLFLSLSFVQGDKVNAKWPGQDGEHVDFVTFFQNTNFEGSYWTFPDSQLSDCGCTVLGGGASGTASSIHTNGHCVVLFEHPNCAGRNLRMEDGTYGYHNFILIDYNDKAKSMRSCACRDQNPLQGNFIQTSTSSSTY